MKISVTGHRPERCDSEGGVRIRFKVCFEKAKPEVVYYGGCQGVDLWAADEARKLGIPIVFVKPWPEHIDTVPKSDRALYEALEAASEDVIIVSEQTPKNKAAGFQKRNERLVDLATHLCAYWDGEPSGTKNTWEYADGKIPRRNIYDWPPF